MSYYKKISRRGCGLICDFAHIFWDGTKFYKLWIKVKIEIKTQYTVGFSEMYICLNLQMNACTVYVCVCQCLWIPINVFVNACRFLFNCVQGYVFWGVCIHFRALWIFSLSGRFNQFPAELHGVSFKNSEGFQAPVWRSTCFLLISRVFR